MPAGQDSFDDRETVLSKNIARSVKALQIIKANPELKSMHMAGYSGMGPILSVGPPIHGTAGSAVSNHYGSTFPHPTGRFVCLANDCAHRRTLHS